MNVEILTKQVLHVDMTEHLYSNKLNIHNINLSLSNKTKNATLKVNTNNDTTPASAVPEKLNQNTVIPNSNLENIDPQQSKMNHDIFAPPNAAFTSGKDIITPPQNVQQATFERVNNFPTPVTYKVSSPMGGLGLSNLNSVNMNEGTRFVATDISDNDGTITSDNTTSSTSNGSYHTAGGNISIRKRTSQGEKNYLSLDDTLKTEHRVVSEFARAKSSSPKRVPSLPTWNESPMISPVEISSTTDIINDHKIIENTRENSNIADILTGYSVENFNETLEWIKLNQIGEGNFSIVSLYKLISRTDKGSNIQNHEKLKFVAVKDIVYRKALMFSDTGEKTENLINFENALKRELSVLQILDHPCLISLYGINDPIFLKDETPLTTILGDPSNNYSNLPPCNIIMPYCSGGDLLSAMSQVGGDLSLILIQRLFTELIMAVKYLHDHSIIHRDLKLENILLNYSLIEIQEMFYNLNTTGDDEDRKEILSKFLQTNNLIKLTDFGLCKKIEQNEMCTARCGSEDYVSPEILMGIPYDGHLSDTWALGVILYSLLEDRLPFDPPKNSTVRQRKKPTSYRIVSYEWRWYKYQDSNSDSKLIVKNTLTRRDHRWDINQIIESPFIKNCLPSLKFLQNTGDS